MAVQPPRLSAVREDSVDSGRSAAAPRSPLQCCSRRQASRRSDDSGARPSAVSSLQPDRSSWRREVRPGRKSRAPSAGRAGPRQHQYNKVVERPCGKLFSCQDTKPMPAHSSPLGSERGCGCLLPAPAPAPRTRTCQPVAAAHAEGGEAVQRAQPRQALPRAVGQVAAALQVQVLQPGEACGQVGGQAGSKPVGQTMHLNG